MIRLGIAPRVADIMRGALSTVDSWFNGVTARFNLTQKAGVPSVSEVPTNQWGIFKNTSTSDVALYVNDNGTLKSTFINIATGSSTGMIQPSVLNLTSTNSLTMSGTAQLIILGVA